MKKKIYYILISLLLLITALTLSMMGIYTGKIVTAISNLDLNAFNISLFVMLLLVIINFTSSNIAFRMIFNLGMEEFTFLKNEIFKRDIRSKSEANIANYTTNTEALYSSRFMVIFNMINLFFTMIFAVLSIIYVNFKLLPIAVIASALPLVGPIIFGKNIEKKSKAFNSFYDFYQKYIAKRIGNKNEFIRYQIEEEVVKEKNLIETQHEQNRKDLKSINILSNISSQSLGSLSYLLIYLSGGYLAFKGEIEIGAILAVVQLMNYLVDPVISLASLMNMYKEAKPIYDKVKESLVIPIVEREKVQLSKPIELIAKNIDFSYDDKVILKDFSYKFNYGKKYLIRGESGKGKSTLAKILAGEISPKSGEVLLNNQDISSFDFRDYILYVDQKPTILDKSVEENIKFYRSSNMDIQALMEKVNLKKNQDNLVSSEEGLSGGEMMRIAILRSLVDVNPIMIYDEPTSAIDQVNSNTILNELLSLDSTVIIISHKMDDNMIKKFDEVIEI